MLDYQRKLVAMLPPPEQPTYAEGEWAAVEEEFGTSLPEDYKWFIQTYGVGDIDRLPIRVNSPFGPGCNKLRSQMEGAFGAYEQLVEDGYEMNYALFPEPGGLFLWGRTGNGDALQWSTTGDPDHWGIVVWKSDDTEFFEFPDMNMVEFLVACLNLEIDIFLKSSFQPPHCFKPMEFIG